jgi:hypothetical protein
VLSGAHGVCELAEPTKLRGATTKVAAEAVRRSGRHPHKRATARRRGAPHNSSLPIPVPRNLFLPAVREFTKDTRPKTNTTRVFVSRAPQ